MRQPGAEEHFSQIRRDAAAITDKKCLKYSTGIFIRDRRRCQLRNSVPGAAQHARSHGDPVSTKPHNKRRIIHIRCYPDTLERQVSFIVEPVWILEIPGGLESSEKSNCVTPADP